MAAFGATDDQIDEVLTQTEDADTDFEVERENWNTLMVFLSCQTQWHKEFAGMDGTLIWHGFNYSGVSVVIRMQGYRGQDAKDIFAGLQTMEAAALPLLNKRK